MGLQAPRECASLLFVTTKTIRLPLRTVSEANGRGHWAPKAKRVKRQRAWAYGMSRSVLDPVRRWFVPVAVKLTRVAPRSLDGDNLQGALKAVRAGVADALGIDDGDPSITWSYAQQKGNPREYAVIVEVSDG